MIMMKMTMMTSLVSALNTFWASCSSRLMVVVNDLDGDVIISTDPFTVLLILIMIWYVVKGLKSTNLADFVRGFMIGITLYDAASCDKK